VLSLESRLGPSVDNELRFQTQWQRLAFQFGEDFRFDLRNRLFAVRDTLSIRATDAVTVRYGLDIEVIAGRISVALPRPPREGDVPLGLDPASVIEARERALFYQPAHFAEVEVEPIESLRIVAGVRNEYYRTGRNWAVDGRFAVRWQALDRWLLKGGVSNHHTPPFFDERSESYGNPDLRPEHAIHAVLGSEITITDALTLDVELYYKDLRDLVAPTDEVTVRDGEEVPVVYDNSGRGRAYGAEVFLRHSFSRNFFGWLSYSIGRSERFDAERDAYRLFDFDQPHVLTALGTYRLPRNWSIGARFRLVSGNPYTPIVGAVYDADRGEYVRTPGRTNSERLPVFHQLDVRVDKRWIRDRRIASLYLDLQNAYNRQNPEGWSYSYDYAERARITGIPIFPALGFRVEW
jgi:hypothetical protein